jgi:hypothetical protein
MMPGLRDVKPTRGPDRLTVFAGGGTRVWPRAGVHATQITKTARNRWRNADSPPSDVDVFEIRIGPSRK